MSQKAWYEDDFEKILFDEATVLKKVRELAADITKDYESIIQKGNELIIVGLLNGSYMFLSELSKVINLPMKVDTMNIKSYNSTNSSGTIKLLKDLDLDPSGSHVLICEDLIGTGNTLHWLQRHIRSKRTASLKICTLVRKMTRRRKVDINIDYCGFECADDFLVGYGMDYEEQYRTLPFIAIFHPKVYKLADDDEKKVFVA
jgi:hypoxanthine phosphoribosyltransferase